MASTVILAGLRFQNEALRELFNGVPMINLFNSKILEDSAGTRWLMELGQIHEARALILAQGAVKLGPITPEDQARIEAIDDLSRLEALSLRLLSVATWAELLAPETTT